MSNFTAKVPLSERMADVLISKDRWKDDEEGYLKVKYGLEIILINAMKFALVYGIALVTGLLLQTLTVHLSYLWLRRYSFGLHATKTLNCTLISLMMFVFAPFVFQNIPSNNWIVLGAFGFILLNMFLFAPADTENLPLIGAEHRKTLKRKAMIGTLILTGIALLIPFAEMKTLIMIGSLFQVISINPLTYKLLRRRYRNYEKYE
ncbi:accessory gene regulator ArgB-like protein [Listeria marthii]|uniref:Putative AgrB-like protein n=1 Tax=Listeria marthii TaxID=529731 RepID=A0A842CQ66_9LIST|nr:accessory gene regulator ArgB-like protein [Listeria marthii]MBC1978373.1 accessory gene regulator ArgB-like protein [Listeria marthii]MBF2399192.1 accessory gene regulator ArgB-like protein [Listeria marthii]MBF2555751.1 accessory gene regulator ArgB-like protein [Listeria marthii]MBF2588886.1 accessory gene regulator ArgB-like protein [Listeria marthii]MBF2675683.1 accessory gene regulator ArgB-like protein [Listeria marthii]